MAFAVTPVVSNASFKVFDITAIDGDVGNFPFAHNFVRLPGPVGVAPLNVVLVPIGTAFHVGQWNLVSTDATNITINKANAAVGSGGTVRVIVSRPHTSTLG